MRGNWESNRQLQQNIVQEQRHPLHSPTTPVWGIIDRIVKGEMKDKTYDSGVSPDHYRSNSASPTSSTANCSLSPGSSTSQDFTNLSCMNFDYNTQRIYKDGDSSLLDYQTNNQRVVGMMNNNHLHPIVHGLASTSNNKDSIDVVSNSMKRSNEDLNDFGTPHLRCPICTFSTYNKLTFSEHLAAHCPEQCESNEFIKAIMNQLSGEEMGSSSCGNPEDDASISSKKSKDKLDKSDQEFDELGMRGIPRMDSQSKVKKYRCKQCKFVSITKLDFWEHNRVHIKVEKLLTCPHCPFVTEYKHHLEYHLRNHEGTKPFKCEKCSYSCVNKSMLNSHLKSHSNVYQYRCADCSYATKYCHSLKLHLRKLDHKPAMVLNPDGSPNPLPIIDVYGTRRGPKQKSKSIEGNNKVNDIPNCTAISGDNMDDDLNKKLSLSPSKETSSVVSPMIDDSNINKLPYNQIPLSISPCAESNENELKQLDNFPTNLLMEYAMVLNNRLRPSAFYQVPQTETVATNWPQVDTKNEVLDLSKTESNKISSPLPVKRQASVDTLDYSKTSGTSRRKGKAMKLERRIINVETDEELSSNSSTKQSTAPIVEEIKSIEPIINKPKNDFHCQYCDIVFGDDIMYTVHMGYHGFKDPYTCNMCGFPANDKMSFFLHIARAQH